MDRLKSIGTRRDKNTNSRTVPFSTLAEKLVALATGPTHAKMKAIIMAKMNLGGGIMDADECLT
jgi:hypothetical protein